MKLRIQKDLFFASLLIFLSVLFLFPLFSSGFYESHDGDAHVARFAAYYQAFQDGQFPPRWAGNLNFGYGTPVFIFYYPLPGWIASVLHFVGLSFEDTFKVLISVSFVAAPLTFYLWARQLFRKEIAFAGALAYGFAPYHFLNLYVRGDVAELLALAFVPLVLWSIEKTLHNNRSFIFLGGMAYGLLLLAHNGVSLMFSPVLLGYFLLRIKTKKQFVQGSLLFAIGLSLSAFFWVPALYEAKYTNANLFIGDMYRDHFPTVIELISSPWGFGANVRDSGGLSPQIGVLPLLFVFGSVVIWFGDKRKHKVILGWFGVFFLAVFITLPLSSFLWEMLPLLRKFEFPWRFVGLASFAASVLACYFFTSLRSQRIFFLSIIAFLLLSLPLLQVKKYVTYDDAYYQSFTGTTYYHGEANPLWTAGDPDTFAKSPVEVIGGEGSLTELSRNTHKHRYVVTAKTPVTILDNTQYYPGWRVSVDGKDTPIQFQDANNPGLIVFEVAPGKHTVLVSFTETSLRRLMDIISLATAATLSIYFLFFFRRRRK